MKFVPQLITFRISHYCEKIRWALDRMGLPYVEECHLPPLHRLKTAPLGGSSVPVLVTEAEVFKNSTDILNYLDEIAAPHLKLYPDSPRLHPQIHELETLFNRKLGVATRQWGYFYGLQNRGLMQQLWCAGVPAWEQALFPFLFPLTRRLVERVYRVDGENAEAAYRETQQIFASVGHRLSDGRRYLVGDCFSAADLTFACLAAPALLPTEYGGNFPQLSQLSDEMVNGIQTLRETVAGQYVLRLYREERHQSHGSR